MIEKLKEYLRHKPNCASYHPKDAPYTSATINRCTCGLDEILAEIEPKTMLEMSNKDFKIKDSEPFFKR